MTRPDIKTSLDGPLQEEGYKFMAAVFAVHNELGGGLDLTVYQESLEAELYDQSIPFDAKPPLTLHYKGHPLATPYHPDLLVYGAILVELKAVYQLLPEHEAHLFNSMRLAQKRVGYLINMGPLKKVEWRRYVV